MKRALQIIALIMGLGLVTAIPTLANQEIGTSPYSADLLVSGLNTGQLDPGEEYWYAFSRLDLGDMAYNSIILSLNFEADGRPVASRVNFQVLDFEQVEIWLQDTSAVESLGLGTPATADFDANTGERFWSGLITANEVYYVRIFNLSPSPVQYRLTALGQKSQQVDSFMAIDTGATAAPPARAAIETEARVEAEPVQVAAAPAVAPARRLSALPLEPESEVMPTDTAWILAAEAIDGLPPAEAAAWLMSAARLGWLPLGGEAAVPVNPNPDRPGVVPGGGDSGGGASEAEPAAVPVDPNEGQSVYPNEPLFLLDGPNTGRMAPKTERWYAFTPGQVDGKLIEDYSLTMFFTPGEPNLARHVTFEMFTGGQYHIWERGTPDEMTHFGAGSWVSRDHDYHTGERLWHGTVIDGDSYFVKLTNNTAEWVDYHLITGDIINTELGPRTAPPETTVMSDGPPTGRDIGAPLPIRGGTTPGQLEPGQEMWYRFKSTSFPIGEIEFRDYRLELAHTPGAGHVRNHVNVEIYPYQMQHIWQRGTTHQIENLGAGSSLAYDRDTDTHTWVWDGNLITNTDYFIRVKNASDEAIDYELLIQGW